MKQLLLILFFNSAFFVKAQTNLDSLWQIWEDESKPDTTRLKAIKEYTWDGFLFTQPDSAYYFAQLQIEFAEKKNQRKHIAIAFNIQGIAQYFLGNYDKSLEQYNNGLEIYREIGNMEGVANCLSNMGLIYRVQGNLGMAIDYFNESLVIRKKIGDKKGIASSVGNLGIIYQERGDYLTAIEFHNQCLKINEDIGNNQGVANSLGNIAVLYDEIEEYNKAIDYMKKSINIFIEIDNKQGEATAYNSLGNFYHSLDNDDEAIINYTKSLNIREEIKDKNGIASTYDNIGGIYRDKGNYKKAIEYYTLSQNIREEIGDKVGIANSLNLMGSIYRDQGKYYKAIEYSSKALKIAEDVGVANLIKNIASSLYIDYKATNQFEPALEMFELYIDIRDSVINETNQQEMIRQEYQYEYEKKTRIDSIRIEEEQKLIAAQNLANNKQHQLESEKQKQQTYFLFGGLILAILFGGFIFNRFRLTNKQKGIIEEQKVLVDKAFVELEIKNTEILDSINYAKRIQSAILPPIKLVKKHLKDSFILYKPKDIVAGDFYWLEVQDGKTFFAAADCTGHGVPGAMVSVICNNGLNRSVREYGLRDPGEILDKTREIVIQEFDKSEDSVTDGMDIALCSLDGLKLQYAGAHNSLWIIRNKELIVIKADKEPIGKFRNPTPYTTHSIDLQIGDAIYIFTDGYADQFGGDKGKKFKTKSLQRLLIGMHSKSMEQQKSRLDEAFEIWKNNLEQIDDVCMIGVRI